LHWYSVSNGLMDSFGIEYHLDDSLLATKDHIPTPNSVKLASEVYKTIKRTENMTEHERGLQELEDVYEEHLDKVRAFAQAFSHRLVEINVDDSLHAGKTLASSFPAKRGECFKFDASTLDKDWKDFLLKL
jgi:D-serine dehydratase